MQNAYFLELGFFLLKRRKYFQFFFELQGGKIIDPADLFFEKDRSYDQEHDCCGALLAPGLIDLQINGGFEVTDTLKKQLKP